MMVIITYDVSVTSQFGTKRLRQISKQCVNYGQRVQNSVFECVIDYATFLQLRKKLLDIMDKENDSIRFYLLGNKHEGKIEHYGIKQGYNPEGFLIV